LKLSVVIPVYNEKKTLNEPIRRVEAFDEDKEIIIVDDASTGGTQDLLKKYEEKERFKIIYQPKNHGIRKGFTCRARKSRR